MRAAALLGCVCLLAAPAFAAEPRSPEQQWLAAVERFEKGDLAGAAQQLQALLRQEPHFRLARWLYGDLLAARSGRALKTPVGESPCAIAANCLTANVQEAVKVSASDLASEASLRLSALRAPPSAGRVPDALLQVQDSSRHAAVVDLSRARLYLLERKGASWAVLRSYFAGIGRKGFGKQTVGDLRTPIGIYRTTGFMADDELPELYGSGALPLDYPNAWDRRQQRTGSGIWLHGVPRTTYVRAPRSSEGCVTLANEDLLAIKPYLLPGRTPVILSQNVQWVAPDQLESSRREFLAHLDGWRKAWSAKDTARYLSYYADDFVSDEGMDRARFAAFKQRVNAAKKFIQVRLDEIEAYRYPGEDALILTRFAQDYRSDNLAKVSRKQQFWRRDTAGRWRILSEETD